VAVFGTAMDLTALREAFEDRGYDVSDVSRNRNQIRVVLLDESPEAGEIRSITENFVDTDEVFGLNVSTESVAGHGGMNTVVTFRHRS
jgi:lactam utilization protein B